MIFSPEDTEYFAAWRLHNETRKYRAFIPVARLIAKRMGLVGSVRHINGDEDDYRRENLEIDPDGVENPLDPSGVTRKVLSSSGKQTVVWFVTDGAGYLDREVAILKSKEKRFEG